MLLSHNPQDQELDFFITFLENAIKGENSYKLLVLPIIEDVIKLAKQEKSLSDLESTGLNVKFSLYQNAPDLLKTLDTQHITNADLNKIKDVLFKTRPYVIA